MKLWDEIGVIMYDNWSELSPERKSILRKELQRKWKSLRDQFMKARKNEKVRNGGRPIKKKKYVYYDHLKFLADHADCRETYYVRTQETDDDDQEKKGGSEGSTDTSKTIHIDTPLLSTLYTIRTSSPFASIAAQKKEKRKLKDQDDGMQETKEYEEQGMDLKREQNETDRMGNRAFLLSILPFLDKMSDEVVMEARMGMMQVIQRCITTENCRGDSEVMQVEQKLFDNSGL
ncbi:hypothetical protein Trydic_g17217 [Trypoxylus dichotomus]